MSRSQQARADAIDRLQRGLVIATAPDPHRASVLAVKSETASMRNMGFGIPLGKPSPLWDVSINKEGYKFIATLSREIDGKEDIGTKIEVPSVMGKPTEHRYSKDKTVLIFRSHWEFLVVPFDRNGRPTIPSKTYRLSPQGDIKKFHVKELKLFITNDAGENFCYDLQTRQIVIDKTLVAAAKVAGATA